MRKTKTLFNSPATVEPKRATIKVGNTPIEIALGIDEQGRTTAKKLYSFLELNQSNYSKWCKRNITENDFAEENVDYFYSSSSTSEHSRGNFAQDYILIATFAKKLAMASNSAKGELAREYFIRVEELLKQAVCGGQGRFSDQPVVMQKVFLDEMELLSLELAKSRYNMGYSTLRKAAEDCSAIVRIYGRVLYSRRKLDKYFESLASSV